MSIHPSLKVDSAGAQQRTVLSRIERIKDLMKKGLWSDDHRVTALPKTKIIKIKAKKDKKEEDEESTESSEAPKAEGSEEKSKKE
jgi:small basic protein (TIGR04137 family)